MSSEQDLELITRMGTGDEHALALFIDKHRKWITYEAFSMLRDRQDAEEVAMDIFNTVWKKSADLTLTRGVYGYFRRIVQSKIVDQHRRQKRQLKRHSLPDSDDEDEDFVFNLLGDEKENPLLRMVDDEIGEILFDIIESIDKPIYRLSWMLRHIHDYSAVDVGRITNVKHNTAKIRIHRFQSFLREALQKTEIMGL